jgi:hypothetical protein
VASGIPTPTYTVHSGALPPGLTLDQVTGVLAGAPTAGGGFTFTIAASNGVNPAAVTGLLSITVFAATPPTFTADSPPGTAFTDAPYSYTFTASGIPAPSIGVASGSLPPGLSLDASTGLLSGTHVTAGTYTFTVQANNGVGSPATSPSIVIVVKVGVVFTAQTPPLGAPVGSPYTYTFAATGDPAPTFSVASGTLPPGLNLHSSTGVLSGTPTSAGAFTFAVTAANGVRPSVTTPSITITVAPGSNGGTGSTGVFLTPSPVNFGLRAVGAAGGPKVVRLTNNTAAPVTGIKVSITGKGAAEFSLVADACSGTTVGPGATCSMSVAFTPAAGGLRSAVLTVVDSAADSPQTDPMSGRGVRTNGYWLGATDGGIFAFGAARFFGSAGAVKLNKPIVALAATPDGLGYWLVASDGGIFAYGSAAFLGSTGSIKLNKPVVGMAATPDGQGYWEAATDGGIFAYGSAAFLGSTGSIKLNKPVVGMAATPDGLGYWLVASDGGIFAFGSATFYGSAGSIKLNKPIVGMAATPDGLGYWLVASDGGLFSYGTAKFLGSVAGLAATKPIVGMAATPDGLGYWLVASDGGIFAYGTAPFLGSTGSVKLNQPIVAMTQSFTFGL